MKKQTKTKIGNIFGDLTIIGPIEIHRSSKNKMTKYIKCTCSCGTEKLINYSGLINGNINSCGCKNIRTILYFDDLQAGDQFNDLTIVNNTVIRRKKQMMVLCDCSCGNRKIINKTSVKLGLIKTCGCIRRSFEKIKIGDKSHMLTVVDNKFITIGNQKSMFILCKCDCGVYKYIDYGQLIRKDINKRTRSCGCAIKNAGKKRRCDISNKKFGKLLVKQLSYNYNHRSYYLCYCECGGSIVAERSNIVSGLTTSCGVCNNIINGRKVSNPQIKLCYLIPTRYYPKLNYSVGSLNIDIGILEHKIAIEYDSWFYHSYKIQKDIERANKLKNNGWKVLSIKTNGLLPSRERLIYSIQNLINSDKTYDEIILEDWGKGPTFEEVLDKKRQKKLLEQGVSNGL